MAHSKNCQCPTCQPIRELEAFVAIRNIHRSEGLTWSDFSSGEPPSRCGPLPERMPEEDIERQRNLHREAVLFSMAATQLPRKRGRKLQHTNREQIELIRLMETLHTNLPGKSDREVLEISLGQALIKNGQRESRVKSKEMQANIKTILNLISKARSNIK